MTICQSLVPIQPAVMGPHEQTPAAEDFQAFEIHSRFLLEDIPRLQPGINSLDHWLDLNA